MPTFTKSFHLAKHTRCKLNNISDHLGVARGWFRGTSFRSPGSGGEGGGDEGLKVEGGFTFCFLFLLFWGTPKDMDLRNVCM